MRAIRKEESMKKIIYLIVIVYFINSILFSSVPLYAAQTTKSIKVTYICAGTPIEGATFSCEQIATVTINQASEEAVYKVNDSYKNILVNSKPLETALEDTREWENCVKALSTHLNNSSQVTYFSGDSYIIGDNGSTTLASLDLGVYLIEFEDFVVKEGDGTVTTYQANSFLVSLPNKVNDDDDWNYALEVAPKVVSREVVSAGNKDPDEDVLGDSTDKEEVAKKTVVAMKFWENGLGDLEFLDEIVVELYGNGMKYNEQALSDANDWSYTWTDLDGSMEWEVKEKDVPEGFVVSYAPNVYGVGLTNSSVLSENIPQTGLVQVPIVILGGIGFILVGIGIFVIRKGQQYE